MKKLLSCILFVLLVPAALLAQSDKASLIQSCQVFKDVTNPVTNFHMAYDITMRGNESGAGTSVKHTDVYKVPGAYKMVIGNDQQVLYTPGRMLVINTALKFMHYSEDTAKTTNVITSTLFTGFLSLIDSARIVESKVVENNKVYTLYFGSSYAYQSAVFTFNAAGNPVAIYALFNQSISGQPFYEMSINYTLWDNNFVVEPAFPGIDQLITKTGDKGYKLMTGLEDYKLYQTLR